MAMQQQEQVIGGGSNRIAAVNVTPSNNTNDLHTPSHSKKEVWP